MKGEGHSWDLSPAAAQTLQYTLRERVVIQPLNRPVETVGGVDVGFPKGEGIARGAVVVLEFMTLALRAESLVEVPVKFPYIPGLLSFREAPAILAALQALPDLPDVLIFDGHGRAHPRRFGIASHLGVLLDRPTIGCAKSILVGKHGPLGEAAGSTADLVLGDELVGSAVRTRSRVRPVYVSVGHKVDLQSAVQVVLACSDGFRIPKPVRLADRLASRRRESHP